MGGEKGRKSCKTGLTLSLTLIAFRQDYFFIGKLVTGFFADVYILILRFIRGADWYCDFENRILEKVGRVSDILLFFCAARIDLREVPLYLNIFKRYFGKVQDRFQKIKKFDFKVMII